jgi:hypothetical protein
MAGRRTEIQRLTARRFPPPWTAEVTPNCFIVRDHNGQALAYVFLLKYHMAMIQPMMPEPMMLLV